MILVDTSVWIDHLRRGDPDLAGLLETERVLTHPFVIGELALGNLKQRRIILLSLLDLPPAVAASDDEVLDLIDQESLAGAGIGYIDAHLLASARLTPDTLIWTRDRRLHAVATQLAVAVAAGGSG